MNTYMSIHPTHPKGVLRIHAETNTAVPGTLTLRIADGVVTHWHDLTLHTNDALYAARVVQGINAAAEWREPAPVVALDDYVPF